jgi:hypothetical protein
MLLRDDQRNALQLRIGAGFEPHAGIGFQVWAADTAVISGEWSAMGADERGYFCARRRSPAS